MSRTGRGFRCANEMRVVRNAIDMGWEDVDGRAGNNNRRLRWPATGEIVPIPSQMNDGKAKQVTRLLERIAKGERLHS